MAGLVDVARVTGLAKSTVSRAFLHPEMVAETTRTRILEAAKELDFRPSRVARALSTGKTGLIGLVVPTLANPFFAPLVLGVQYAAEAEDRHALIVASEYSRDRENALVERLSSEVDGFVMVSPVGSDQFLRAMARRRSLVLVDRKVGRVPTVLIDTPSGLAEVTTRLLAEGHCRVGYISGPQHSWLDAQRLASIQAAAEVGGAAVSVFGPLPPTVEAGLAVAAAVTESGVTAIIAYNSSIVLGLMTGLSTAVGFGAQKIAVACADSLIDFSHHAGSIITLDAPVEKAGFVAMRKLSALLAGENTRPVDVLPTQVIG